MQRNPSIHHAMPFWMSLLFVPMVWLSATQGGWMLALVPVYGWLVVPALDGLIGRDMQNMDPDTPDISLSWYRLITLIWPVVQIALILGVVAAATSGSTLSQGEAIGLAVCLGVVTGTVGITYAHELIHQKNRVEQGLGELLLVSVLYGHFKSEHILVHHRYVGTPRDPVTARYDEGFYHYFFRVLYQQVLSAWRAEAALLARKGLSAWHRSNPFWRYAAGSAGFALASWAIGGWFGVAIFSVQAFTAILHLELVNYIEHYGLVRRHLGSGKYEHVQPRHSWNAAQKVSNFLLINLQRHSDHHYKPNRRFPLLQNYDEDQAPQLPHGYPYMVLMALVPPLWRWRMNGEVDAWRARYYPDIEDWSAYTLATNPQPR